jgi:glycosyltransferase involved in cell wall biosynthesis
MNILYILYYYPVCGGTETVTITLANEMVKRGHNVSIAYCIDKTIEKIPYNIDSRIKTIKLLNTNSCNTKDIEKLKNYIVENKIDIIISQQGNVKLYHKAYLNTKCKLVMCRHSSVYRNTINMGKVYKQKIKRMLGPIYKFYDIYRQIRLHNKNYKMSDKYVFLCSNYVEEYKRLSGNRDRENKLTFIYNPIKCKNSGIDFSEKHKEVLFVGRVVELQKRFSYLLKIWKIIESNERYNDWHLTIVGDGEDLPTIKEFAQKLQLKNISFEGFQNPEKFYRIASVFLMTSVFEGLPMTLIEAQNFGCIPVAMDSFASIRDIIDDGQNGFIIPNNDLNSFAEKICILMDDVGLREKMAKNGMESVKKFSLESIIEKWEELFEELNQTEIK